jgi:thiol:disulfide interchange protein
MTREVYTDKKFIEFTSKYVFIRLFQDTDPQGARLASRYRVEGFPTLIIFDSSGREVDRILGFRNAPDLIETIQSITKDDGRITL